MTASTKTALLYVLPAIAVLIAWYILLFAGNTANDSPVYTLRFVLTEGPSPHFFWWLLALPLLCLGLAIAYLSRLSRSRIGSGVLLGLGVALAVAAWATVTSEIAFFATLPILYGFVSAKEQFLKNNGVRLA